MLADITLFEDGEAHSSHAGCHGNSEICSSKANARGRFESWAKLGRRGGSEAGEGLGTPQSPCCLPLNNG